MFIDLIPIYKHIPIFLIVIYTYIHINTLLLLLFNTFILFYSERLQQYRGTPDELEEIMIHLLTKWFMNALVF